jgi:16S rRNA (cytosine967-C5)-methyltransferase
VANHHERDHGRVTEEHLTAREIAAIVLERVESGAAFASLALDAELDRAKLDRRDAGLATEIVYGALRVLPDLDTVIGRVLSRPDTKLDSLVHAVLRAAVYQLLYLDRVPAHAIVDAAVGFLSRKRNKKVAGFANALLRRIARDEVGKHTRQAIVLPQWLQDALIAGVGQLRFDAVAKTQHVPGLCLRIAPQRVTREALIERLRASSAEITVSASSLSPWGVLVAGAGDPRKLPGYDEGLFTVQEEGAQVVTLACGAKPGEHVLDACAGHGGKATWFAHAVDTNGSVTAFDLHERKLERLVKEAARLGLNVDRITKLPVDLSVGTGGVTQAFDRVIVDAPCTGTGTLMRRPELALRLRPEDPPRLATLQRTIVESAARLLKPDGVLVYAICSLTKTEGIDVIEAIDRTLLVRCDPDVALPHALDDDGVLRIGAWSGDGKESVPDGYQLAWFRRRSGA